MSIRVSLINIVQELRETDIAKLQHNNITLDCLHSYYYYLPKICIHNWGEHERAPHRQAKHEKICMYLCMFVSLTQISLTPIATLYDNGCSGRVQNSSRHLITVIWITEFTIALLFVVIKYC